MQEVGHFLAAFPKKVKLSIPYFIPNITLGSFGAITQVNIFAILVHTSNTLMVVSSLCLICICSFQDIFFLPFATVAKDYNAV